MPLPSSAKHTLRRDGKGLQYFDSVLSGTRQAELYLRTIQASVRAVAADPIIAKNCEHVRKGYFRYPAGAHMLFVRLTRDGVNVVHILHPRIDFKRHL
jgi:toxin ParE1/3/4